MSLHNYPVAIDMRHIFRLLFCTSVGIIFLISSCATIETSKYPEGPYVVSTYPSPGDFNISRYTDINIRFSEMMDPGTEIGIEVLANGISIEGSKRWSDSNTALIFRPYKPLDANSMYQCIMRGGKSKDGKPLVGVPYIWMFTTGN